MRERVILDRKQYDIAWLTAAVSGACAVIAADGNYQALKPYEPFFLAVSVLIAVALSFFVERHQEARPEAVADEISIDAVASTMHRSTDSQTIIAPPTELEAEFVMSEAPLDKKLPQNVVVGTVSEVAMQAVVFQYLDRHLSRARRLAEVDDRIWSAITEQKNNHRRNILSEACDIARSLQGTGSEVLVLPDDCILIRENRPTIKHDHLGSNVDDLARENRSTLVH